MDFKRARDFNKIGRLMIFVLICLLAGAIGSIFTLDSVKNWYPTLNKPAFTPPNWIFGSVWIILYILIGASAYLVYDKKGKETKNALTIFGIQLGLNILWPLLFFGLRSPLYGLICILLLWAAILLTMIRFYAISKTAGLLIVPYALWVSFASLLNFYILILN